MFSRCLDAVLAALLLVFLLPSFFWYLIRTGLHSRATVSHRNRTARVFSLKQQFAAEFNFERAIEAYEQLIDSTFAESRP